LESKRELINHTKISAIFALILLASMVMAAINPYVTSVKAQGQATVIVLDSIGGSTDPVGPGNYSYDAGTGVTFTATPDTNLVFLYWIISTSAGFVVYNDNPLTLTVTGGVTYLVQPVFQGQNIPLLPFYPSPDLSADAIIGILPSAGGTTEPAPGTYAVANATQVTIRAIPDNGWQFVHWVISGGPMTGHGGSPFTATPTDNPYTVGHGYGFTYDYQPVFIPTGTTAPTPTPTSSTGGGISTETTIIIALAVVIVIILVAVGAFEYMRRSKK
jgi:hypothetical protein